MRPTAASTLPNIPPDARVADDRQYRLALRTIADGRRGHRGRRIARQRLDVEPHARRR
jgi:hypothetical protein